MVAIEAFLSLEASLSRRLSKHWNDQFRKVRPELMDALEKQNWLTAATLIERFDFKGFVEQEKNYVKTLGTSAMLYGASRFITPKKTSVYRDRNGLDIVDVAVNQFETLLDQSGVVYKNNMHSLVTRYKELLQQQKSDVILKASLPRNMANPRVLTETMQQSGEQSINVSSSLYNSRLSSYGFLVEATYTGVTTYSVNEQMDSRTCPVCNHMHGQSFEVSSTITRLDRNLRVDNPDLLKNLAPFYPQNKESIERLQNMTRQQMADSNLAAPPYHPLCRGILVASETDVTVATQTVYDSPNDDTVTSPVLQNILISSLLSNFDNDE